MLRPLLALALLGIATGANALLVLSDPVAPRAPEGKAPVLLGERQLAVPRAMMRDRGQQAGGRLDRLDLALAIADFSPLPPLLPGKEAREPERITLVLQAAQPGPDAQQLFQAVYARHVMRETWSNPGGLVMRRFRPGTPYEDRELYIGAGGRRIFVALCPREAITDLETCTAQLRQDGLDIEMRFEARHLPDWRRLLASTLQLVGELTASPAPAAKAN